MYCSRARGWLLNLAAASGVCERLKRLCYLRLTSYKDWALIAPKDSRAMKWNGEEGFTAATSLKFAKKNHFGRSILLRYKDMVGFYQDLRAREISFVTYSSATPLFCCCWHLHLSACALNNMTMQSPSQWQVHIALCCTRLYTAVDCPYRLL